MIDLRYELKVLRRRYGPWIVLFLIASPAFIWCLAMVNEALR